jgi:curved DNA-binding protein CbpA
MRDLYSVLNLSRGASSKDIKAAYWALAKQFHPDINTGDKDAEGWTKEINRAYEILGDASARAAYDLGLTRQRAKARRSFLGGAAAGAATLILTVSSISIALVWKQSALPAGSVKNEMVVRAPAQERTTLKSDRSEPKERGVDPGEPVSAPLPGPPSELPATTSPKMTSVAPSDRAARVPDEPAPSSVATEDASREAQPRAVPSKPSRVDMSEEQQPVPHAPETPPPPRTEPAIAASPEFAARQALPTVAAGREPSSEPSRSDGYRNVQAVDKKPKKRMNVPRVAATGTPNKPQGSEREPRLVSSRATALRWPSADEPFVNLGARNR